MFDGQNTIPDLLPHGRKISLAQFYDMSNVIVTLGSYVARNYEGEDYDIALECIAVIAWVLGEYAGCSCDTCCFMETSILEMMEEIHRRAGEGK